VLNNAALRAVGLAEYNLWKANTDIFTKPWLVDYDGTYLL
jgi:hypothetical protein